MRVSHFCCLAQTASLSVGVGTACTVYEPVIVLEALVLTATIVLSLTAYTFHAARKGYSFSYLGPILFTGAHPALQQHPLFAALNVLYPDLFTP